MEWVEQVQRDLGAPVVAFAQQNWVFLLIVGLIAVMWLFGSGSGRGDASVGVWFGGGSDNDGDSGSDGGGGDGGGGGD